LPAGLLQRLLHKRFEFFLSRRFGCGNLVHLIRRLLRSIDNPGVA
jgi:hypothetical protein